MPKDGTYFASPSPASEQGRRVATDMKDAMKFIISVGALLVVMLVLSTAAYGQASIQGYNDRGGQIQAQVEEGGGGGGGDDEGGAAPVVTSDEGGSLPFTGLDVALLAAAGGLLAAAGLGMRRLTRASESA
jgi:hypothetical protein